ncbi:hypothetical protein P3T76_005658 [Phytophthora citrophthora]|uniref:Uncharacterized protein n=1 Tax=Phytophthora citrophthora TaxID=4793 RepID=A0AAD9GRV0_9STRA|nr:hypothetical protein P3T76_005658 [Phytophthora citrophthora]
MCGSAMAELLLRLEVTSFRPMVSAISSPSSADSYATPSRKKDPASKALWEAVMREQWQREQKRRRMVRWRLQKKESVASMLQERRHLERKLHQRLFEARVATDELVPTTIDEAFRLSTIELASLKRENLVLQETIAQHMKFEAMLDKDTKEILYPISEKESALKPATMTTTKAKAKLQPKPLQLPSDGGWRVHFPNGEPSFYFTPFTRSHFDEILSNNDVAYAQHHPCTAAIGKILGWDVDYAPLATRADGSSCIAHTRFTRQLKCSLDTAERILSHLDKRLWPVLAAQRSWGRTQSGGVQCQVLQSFTKNEHVIAYNIPGPVNLRYIALARNVRERNSEGKRVDKYILTIGDSKASANNRDVENSQDVQWVLEGGMYMTITEVDAETINIVFDNWVECLNESHGRELYVDWVRFPFGLEQHVSPVRLLRESNEAALVETVTLEQVRREQQRVRMGVYRAKKKERIARMVQERLQLEKELNARVSAYQTDSRAIRMAKENLVLQRVLEQQKKLQQVIHSEYGKFMRQLQDFPPPPSLPDLHNQGWRVYFPNAKPSFYYRPFKRSEYDSVMKSYDDLLRSSSTGFPATGKLFGWTVQHSPLCRREGGKVVARSKLTTRVRCVLDDVDTLITSSNLSAWPLLVTPPNWSHNQRANFTRRVPMIDESGKRSILFSAVASDSKANARGREAEDPDGNIVWIGEGGHSITFTEANDGAVAIVYDHWAACEDELHAQHLYIRCAHNVTACYWSQRILTPNSSVLSEKYNKCYELLMDKRVLKFSTVYLIKASGPLVHYDGDSRVVNFGNCRVHAAFQNPLNAFL